MNKRPIDYNAIYKAFKTNPTIKATIDNLVNAQIDFENQVEERAIKGFLYFHRIVEGCKADIWDFILLEKPKVDSYREVIIHCSICDTQRIIYYHFLSLGRYHKYMIMYDKDQYSWFHPGGDQHE